MSEFYLEIRPRTENESDPGFRRMGPMSNRDVVTCDAGANRNLNHRNYYTKIISAEHGHGWRSDQGLRAEENFHREEDSRDG